jgi:CYTH domain-containing protein
VRIRQRDDAGFLTIKGKKTGAVAAEFEYPLPGPDIAPLLALCGSRLVQKARYKIPGPDGQVWELDLFSGQHQGLMIAELELQQEKSPYLKPDWLGPEITQDPRFSNANLSRCDRAEVSGWILEYGK